MTRNRTRNLGLALGGAGLGLLAFGIVLLASLPPTTVPQPSVAAVALPVRASPAVVVATSVQDAGQAPPLTPLESPSVRRTAAKRPPRASPSSRPAPTASAEEPVIIIPIPVPGFSEDGDPSTPL
ncbi:MAG: hypothetical protein WCI05_12920 [Myxococcales bacterium]